MDAGWSVETLRRLRRNGVAGNGQAPRRAVFVLVALLTLLIGACSSVRLAYDHLGLLVRHEVGEFVDLDADQQQRFNADFDVLWQANRSNDLPKYAATLRQLAASASQPMLIESLKQWNRRFSDFTDALGRNAARSFAPLVASLTDAQVTGLLAKIDRRDEKRRRRAARRDAGENRAQEQDDIETQLKKWTGDESPAQHALIFAWLRGKPPDENARIDQLGQAWRQALAQLLAQRHSPGFAAELEIFLTDPQFPERGAMQPFLDRERDRGLLLWVDLSRTLSPAQRRHLSDKMNAYADDFEALANEKPPV